MSDEGMIPPGLPHVGDPVFLPETPEPEIAWMSDECHELFTALALAQGEIRGALRRETNDYYKSKYADLDSVWESIREPLSKNGLCVIQTMQPHNRKLALVTMLGHKSGQWMRSMMPVNPDKGGSIHAVGSAITYLRRYALMAIVGVSPADDDGNAATTGGR